jgi:GAF domain-containing protein
MYDHKLYLQMLAGFTTTLLAPYEVDTVFAELAGRVTDLLGLAGSGVCLARDDRLVLHTSVGPELAALERIQDRNQDGPCVTAFRTGRPVAIEDLATEAYRWPTYCQSASTAGICAVASIPMRLGDATVGVLDLYAQERRSWPEDDVAAATVMANMATAFLINASYHRKQIELNEHLQHALDSRITVEQAKGVLAARLGVTPDEGFDRLRRYARNRNATVRDVARAVIEDRLEV